MTDPFAPLTEAHATASERANDAHAEWQKAQAAASAATEKADALFQEYMKLTYARDQAAAYARDQAAAYARDQAADALYEVRIVFHHK